MDLQLKAQLADLLPEMLYTLPYVGTIDLGPIVVAFLLFLALTLAFWVLQKVVIVQLSRLAAHTSTKADDVVIGAIRGIRPWVYSLVALFISLKVFALPEIVDKVLTFVVLFAVVWQAIEVAVHFLDYLACRFLEKDEDGDGVVDPNSAMASEMVTLMARIMLWTLGVLFVLSNLGIEVTSLIAGLGIGGIAIAFALQGILSDLFASFSLYFDKPFRIGDFIIIGNNSGTVERIGIKTTRIRTLQGEELVVSNNELTTARVQNFKKMKERRIEFRFGVTYETSKENMHRIPSVVRELFETTDRAHLNRVHFVAFGDSALMFEVIYNVESSDYTEYLDVQQAINFGLLDRFTELGIEFAYPTQTVFVKK